MVNHSPISYTSLPAKNIYYSCGHLTIKPGSNVQTDFFFFCSQKGPVRSFFFVLVAFHQAVFLKLISVSQFAPFLLSSTFSYPSSSHFYAHTLLALTPIHSPSFDSFFSITSSHRAAASTFQGTKALCSKVKFFHAILAL